MSGYRETAYGQAMMTAGMVIQISRACMRGDLDNCGCVKQLDHVVRFYILFFLLANALCLFIINYNNIVVKNYKNKEHLLRHLKTS